MDKQIILFPISIEEVKSVIKECIKAELAKFSPPEKKEDELLTTIEAQKYLKVSKVTLAQWRKKGILNFKRIGSRIRYVKSEVVDAVRAPRKYGRGA